MSGSGLYGYMAEFEDSKTLVRAAERAKEAGYSRMEAYSPMPIHGISEALGQPPSRLPWAVFLGGLLGASGGYLLQYWTSAVDYPINIGGRPLNSWPAFIPVTFECAILFAALTAVFGMFILNGLPKPHHPVFNVEAFSRASVDRFFLCIETEDPKFDAAQTKRFLQNLGATAVCDVAF